MSLDHKAYLFDHGQFDLELRSLLEAALVTNDVEPLVTFIDENRSQLVHPDEGTPLDENWQAAIERGDPHEYGDLALTKYYDPNRNIGLSHDWQEVQNVVAADNPSAIESPILGSTVGPEDNPFDPGKLGSYFQTQSQVRNNFDNIRRLLDEWGEDPLNAALEMLREAVSNEQGLYVTF